MAVNHQQKAGLPGLLLLSTLFAVLPAAAEPIALDIASAETAADPRTGQPTVVVKMSEASRRAFGQYSSENVGRLIEVRVDGRVVLSAVLRTPILGGSVQLGAAGLTASEAQDLAARIKAGAKVEVEALRR